jgi:hypothetical protein
MGLLYLFLPLFAGFFCYTDSWTFYLNNWQSKWIVWTRQESCMNQHVRMFWKVIKANGFSLSEILYEARDGCVNLCSVPTGHTCWNLLMVMWPSGLGGQGCLVTSFENWNPTAADVQGLEGSYCGCKIQCERVWGKLWDPCFVRRLCIVPCGQTWI